MKEALAQSLNIPAVKTLYLAGVNNSINTAKSMGITTLNDPPRYGLSLVLGGGEVTLLDHVNAFGTFATAGVRHDKTAILKITDGQGKTLARISKFPGRKSAWTRLSAQKLIRSLTTTSCVRQFSDPTRLSVLTIGRSPQKPERPMNGGMPGQSDILPALLLAFGRETITTHQWPKALMVSSPPLQYGEIS